MLAPICSYCQLNPGTNGRDIWNGFRDADTNQYVCWTCRADHYKHKATQGMQGLYSEMPVVIFNPQLKLHL